MVHKLNTTEDIQQFVQAFDTFLLDMDGVLWQGNTLLPQVAESLTRLRQLSTSVMILECKFASQNKEFKG
jgi:4-nitrophenyl phosphatase